jgi:hypothetical protein
LYINDLPECLNNTRPRLFADDTHLTASCNSIADIELAVNSDLDNLRNWLIANKLSLDVAKTEFMLIGSPQMIRNVSNFQPNILIANKQIRQVNKTKTLGTTIDQHLTWKTNTENICLKKITLGISDLRRVSNHLLPIEIRLFLCTMLLYVHTSIIVLKFGMYLAKHNINDCKNYKTELLELFLISAMM